LPLKFLLAVTDGLLEFHELHGIKCDDDEMLLREFQDERQASGFLKELYVLQRKNWLA